jgi:hypothetical protein
MNIQAPEIVYIILVSLSLGITAAQHGEPKKGKESIFQTLISHSLTFALLYWGGFFS